MAWRHCVLDLVKLARDRDISWETGNGQAGALTVRDIRNRYFRWEVNEYLTILRDYLCRSECNGVNLVSLVCNIGTWNHKHFLEFASAKCPWNDAVVFIDRILTKGIYSDL